MAADGQDRATSLRQGAAAWAHRLDEVYVQAEDRSRLDLFAFPGMSARQLFLAAYAGERTGPGQADPPDPPPTLVGTLTAR